MGGMARLAVLSTAAYDAVKASGGLAALLNGLTCPDPTAQCFAAGAVGITTFTCLFFAGISSPAIPTVLFCLAW